MREQPGSDRDDRARLRRLASGETDALAELYDLHAERLHAHALWVLGSREDAEDAVQRVFVRLAGMGGSLLGIRRPAAYLFRMARREALQILRRSAARAEKPFAGALVREEGSGPEERAEIAMIERKIGRLDPVQREVVYLHLYEGLTFREIGKLTGAPTFTAASRYRLALARLRRELEGS
jgi:RNA polymerase sigma-70 factor (ECF subfamily)